MVCYLENHGEAIQNQFRYRNAQFATIFVPFHETIGKFPKLLLLKVTWGPKTANKTEQKPLELCHFMGYASPRLISFFNLV